MSSGCGGCENNKNCEGCKNRQNCGGCTKQENEKCFGSEKAGNLDKCKNCPNREKCLNSKKKEECFGSELAGKLDKCKNCPNRDKCLNSKKKERDPDLDEIQLRLKDVKNIIPILSGKGGVGKSTVTSQLAFYLASKGYQVGVLDLDVTGPSQPKMFNVEVMTVHETFLGWDPVYVNENIGVMSIGFVMQDRDSAVIWRGPRKSGLIKQFLKSVNWGEIDYLLIDTPPGTSDEHLSIIQYIGSLKIDGAILVSTPQEVSLMDVRREIGFCQKSGIDILGIVENMSYFVCPKCNFKSQIFKPTTGGVRSLCKEENLDFLGEIPIDISLRKACDKGVPYLTELINETKEKKGEEKKGEEKKGEEKNEKESLEKHPGIVAFDLFTSKVLEILKNKK
ncbi:cytosolic fe-s cluster assembly factor nubp1 [Anaeramoeba flamelloides]|uniref:Cytosolic fe-s cluster assembly factor nubp1 n=1 Tax=Anaeramoeba flamelloides TaxID=1746091 RepID=A0AAV7ZEM5_9EUKA|nr:cytosolic fe-s cluster assembly factor nubp1 [Anaeramoeba flamelloides]